MANKSIKDFPENTSPSGEWFVLVDDGTGCYYKVKLKNLPGGGVFTTTSTSTTGTTTTAAPTTTSTTSSTTTAAGGSTTSSTTSSSTTSTTTSTTTGCVSDVTDPDALAFIDATGITDCIIKNALQAFVAGVKSDGLWTKMKAIYPFVGGTASTHKFNLKNPADTDAAFRIVFNGGVTHNANGVTFDGLTGYGDTKFDITKFTSITNLSTGVYIRTTRNLALDDGIDFGVENPGVNRNFLYVGVRYYPNSGAFITQTLTDGQPYGFINASVNGTASKIHRNGTLTISGVTANDIPPAAGQNWFVGAANNTLGGASDFSNRNYAFMILGDALSDGENTSLYNRIQTFQTALGRQVV